MDRMRARSKDREVNLALPKEVLLVEMDGVLVEQVVVNLLENAAKHTPDGEPDRGARRGSTRRGRRGGPRPRAGGPRRRGGADLRTLPSPPDGQRASRARASASRSAARSFGRTEVESSTRARPGGGATFRVHPAARAGGAAAYGPRREARRDDAKPLRSRPFSSSRTTRPVRRVLASTLPAHGFRVLEADDRAAALRDAAQYVPDLVLLDLGLPDLDGIEVTRRLRDVVRDADRRAHGARAGEREGRRRSTRAPTTT